MKSIRKLYDKLRHTAESFATVSIDAPARTSVSKTSAKGGSESDVDWSKALPPERAEGPISPLAPDPGEDFRIIPMTQLLKELSLKPNEEGELDDATILYMQHKLYKQDLRMANRIAGPLRMRLADNVAIYDAHSPEVSTRSTLTVGLYLMLWLVQADGVDESDFDIIDRYIAEHEGKGADVTAARATARWLASRRLVFTRKRKIRASKLDRYPLRRALILRSLLQLVADATNVSDKRMRRLATIYETLGLDPHSIHADIHRMATGEVSALRKAPAEKPVALDNSKLMSISQSTEKAQALLADVFAENEEPTVTESKHSESTDSGIMGLLSALSAHDVWRYEDFAALCKRFSLTPGAALESLNDLSYDTLDEAVVSEEDDGSIAVDLDLAKELIDTIAAGQR